MVQDSPPSPSFLLLPSLPPEWQVSVRRGRVRCACVHNVNEEVVMNGESRTRQAVAR